MVCIAGRERSRADELARAVGGPGLPLAVKYRDMPQCATHVIVAVADAAIEEVAQELARDPGKLDTVVHTSGAYDEEVLQPLAKKGVACGAMHPLQTFAGGPEDAAALRAIAFTISGDAAAVKWAEELAQGFGGQVLRIGAEQRSIYHAAAVMASNYLTVMVEAARELMVRAGVAEESALTALAPLVRRSIENTLERGPLASLTGPVVRGDAPTVAAHLRALAGDDSLRGLYRAAGVKALTMARQRGLREADASKIQEALWERN